MVPVIFTIGKISISSFGLLLALGFLYGTFLIWRLARAWDLEEEKILDLVVLTFLGGLIMARIYYVSEHLSFFSVDLIRVFLITSFPGLSFWGGFLGGWLSLYFFSKRLKLSFWQVADVAVVGFLAGLIFADWGCLLGGCSNGIESNLFLAVNIVGLVGKRFPVQALEAILVTLVLIKIWGQATRFHVAGKIVSSSLIYLGLIKLVTEFFRDSKTAGFATAISGYYFSLIVLILGVVIGYRVHKSAIRVGKTTFRQDLQLGVNFIGSLFTSRSSRVELLRVIVKSWYNMILTFKNSLVLLRWRFRNLPKILKRIHVKTTPKNIRNY